MELHINWLCWKLTVAVKGSRQSCPSVSLCPLMHRIQLMSQMLHQALHFKVSTDVVRPRFTSTFTFFIRLVSHACFTLVEVEVWDYSFLWPKMLQRRRLVKSEMYLLCCKAFLIGHHCFRFMPSVQSIQFNSIFPPRVYFRQNKLESSCHWLIML